MYVLPSTRTFPFTLTESLNVEVDETDKFVAVNNAPTERSVPIVAESNTVKILVVTLSNIPDDAVKVPENVPFIALSILPAAIERNPSLSVVAVIFVIFKTFTVTLSATSDETLLIMPERIVRNPSVNVSDCRLFAATLSANVALVPNISLLNVAPALNREVELTSKVLADSLLI